LSQTWRSELEEAGLRLLAILLPPVCVACDRIEGIVALDLGLCTECRQRLQPTPGTVCPCCGRAMGTEPLPDGYLCGSCRRNPPPFERILSGWSYEPPLVEVIHALKFRRLPFLGGHLGRALGNRFKQLLEETDLVVPVPLHWRRHLLRGFNQAEEIARPIAEELDLPLVRALRRKTATQPQTGLDRASRAANLRGAFTATRTGRRRVSGRQVLLVDDVVTTRNTLGAAADCLLRSGATSVICLAGGRTPEPI